MCPNCYEECIEAKISSINLSFLKLSIGKEESKVKICMYPAKDHFCGFTEEEILKSWKYKRTIAQIHGTVMEGYKKVDYNNNNNRSFLGFSDEEMNESMECHKLLKESMHCKGYRKPCLKNLKSTCSRGNSHSVREDHRKTIRQQRTIVTTSKYFKTKVQTHSKYFSKAAESPKPKIKVDSNKELEAKHFKPEPNDHEERSGYFLKPNNRIAVKIEEEHESNGAHIKEELGVDFETEYFKINYSFVKTEPKWTGKTEDAMDSSPDEKSTIWIPPRSPHNLIEEVLYHDPWALLVATIFLNKTTCKYARPFIFWFLKENPHPLKVLERYPVDLEKYFVKLGLQRRRAVQVWRMSHDFVHKDWRSVKELYGVGKYGDDAFRMFCRGDFTVNPDDRFLRIYKAWYEKIGNEIEKRISAVGC